jgi:hypothetical protein
VTLILDWKPLVVLVTPAHLTEASVKAMNDEFVRFYAQNERYALITVPTPGAPTPNAQERKLVGEWASSETIQTNSGRLCVASGVVFTSTLARGALTAILWLWRPAFPIEFFGSVEPALDFCIKGGLKAGLPLPKDAAKLKAEIIARVSTLAPYRE